jgi:hypothetical protein
MEAHEELVRIRPFRNASLQVWLLYYQRSVTVYEQIAQTDPAHQGEAQYWAVREHAHAQQIEARLKGLESA